MSANRTVILVERLPSWAASKRCIRGVRHIPFSEPVSGS